MNSRKREIPLIRTFDDLIHRAREISGAGEPHRVAVAGANDEAVIEAVVRARNEGIAEALLFGDAERILPLLEQHNTNPRDFKVVNTSDDDETTEALAAAVYGGKADIIMKGNITTSKLLKNVLKQKYGLRRKGLLSHTAILSPKRYPKLLAVTDGGMVVSPSFEQKVEIIRNAVLVDWALGIEVPKVAVTTTIDYIVPDFPETFEAAALSKMAQRGQIKSCEIDGPMSFDTAIWAPAVEYEGIVSPVAGQADIVMTGSIEEGNILAKSLVQFAGAAFGGVIVGAKVPISLVSRADDSFNKLASIALAVVVSHYIRAG